MLKSIMTLDEIGELSIAYEAKRLDVPVPLEGEISIVGSTALPVIDLEGTVYQPLHDKVVKVTLKLTLNNRYEMKEFTVSVLGRYANEGTNEKPAVIPEVAEWYGLTGDMAIDDTSSVVVKDNRFIDAAYMFIEDLKDMNIFFTSNESSETDNTIIFQYDEANGYQTEGYGISIDNNRVVIKAAHHTGAFYATRTLLQMLKNSERNSLNNGYIRDYPMYPIRGFMLDVGRKFTHLEYIYDIMKTLSYYKMNDFQIHLNDDAFLEHHYDAKEALKKAYSGFRLESVLKGNEYKLTSEDGFYTKEQFTNLIAVAAKYGIRIVPEIDTPGHALSIIRIRPHLMYAGNIIEGKTDQERAAMLDISKEETVSFIKSLYNEFLDGDNPVIGNVPVHIGSDEYYGETEDYRKYVDDLLSFIRDEKNRIPRVWGSLSTKKGKTPVTSENVQMDLWNTNWANPDDMLELGFDIINIEDHQVYLVPGADYYHDYLETEELFRNYQPNKFLNGTVINESHPQLLGGSFALWNDQIDIFENGITSYDMFDRIFDALPVIAQKNWGSKLDMTYTEFRELSSSTGYAPHTNPRFRVSTSTPTVLYYDFLKGTKDISGNGYHVVKEINVSKNQGIEFNGKKGYLETPLQQIGPDAILSIELKLNQTKHKQVLFETDSGGKIFAVNHDGYIGYEYENNTYSYNYKLQPHEKTKLTFISSLHKTTLLVNDKTIPLTEDTAKSYNTFIMPLHRIGSSQNTIDGLITEVKVEEKCSSACHFPDFVE